MAFFALFGLFGAGPLGTDGCTTLALAYGPPKVLLKRPKALVSVPNKETLFAYREYNKAIPHKVATSISRQESLVRGALTEQLQREIAQLQSFRASRGKPGQGKDATTELKDADPPTHRLLRFVANCKSRLGELGGGDRGKQGDPLPEAEQRLAALQGSEWTVQEKALESRVEKTLEDIKWTGDAADMFRGIVGNDAENVLARIDARLAMRANPNLVHIETSPGVWYPTILGEGENVDYYGGKFGPLTVVHARMAGLYATGHGAGALVAVPDGGDYRKKLIHETQMQRYRMLEIVREEWGLEWLLLPSKIALDTSDIGEFTFAKWRRLNAVLKELGHKVGYHAGFDHKGQRDKDDRPDVLANVGMTIGVGPWRFRLRKTTSDRLGGLAELAGVLEKAIDPLSELIRGKPLVDPFGIDDIIVYFSGRMEDDPLVPDPQLEAQRMRGYAHIPSPEHIRDIEPIDAVVSSTILRDTLAGKRSLKNLIAMPYKVCQYLINEAPGLYGMPDLLAAPKD